jgi:uncharacterized membrane protein HdeD (DUF308 family)
MSSRTRSAYRVLVGVLLIIFGVTSASFGSTLNDALLLWPGMFVSVAGLALLGYAHYRRKRLHRW